MPVIRSYAAVLILLSLPVVPAWGQAKADGFGVCKPISQRTQEVGCWIITDNPVGKISAARVYWHLDSYPSRAAAEAAKGPNGTVLESLGKVWLMTIEKKGWRPQKGGEHVADIGPLEVHAGTEYSAVFMEAIFEPGMTSSVHMHSGPEAWYTVSGETCLETPSARYVGSASKPVVVPQGPPMYLTAIGKEQRRAITLILHDASKPPTSIVHDWQPKGLCK